MSLSAVFPFTRKKTEPKEVSWRAVSCKRCGVRIAIPNRKLDNQFSIKCTACDHRTFYTEVDVVVTSNTRRA
jgi:DNA-directed RNA polymerase subunit RPC12/RpoP